MKKTTLLFVLSLIMNSVNAQNWLWARTAIGTNTAADEGNNIAIDRSNNIYVIGNFNSPSLAFGTYTLTNSGTNNENIFLAKYDEHGTVLWAKSSIGTGNDQGLAIAMDSLNNCYISGYFTSPTLIMGSYTLTNTGNTDIFIAKYDSLGNIKWARSIGGPALDEVYSLKTGGNNFYITGRFSSPTITFGSYTLTNSVGGSDAFLVKYDSSGTVLWATHSMGCNAGAYGLTVDAKENIYITGRFGVPSVNFGSINLTNSAGWDVFITKYDALGNVIWARKAGAAGYDEGHDIVSDNSGNIYITGFFDSPAIAFGTTTLNNSGNYDAFIVKYDSSGNNKWAKKVSSNNWDQGMRLEVDFLGNVYLTGVFLNAPSISCGSYTLTTPAGSVDPEFIIKYDSIGNILCGTVLSSGGDDYNGIVADKFGSIYLCGDYASNPFIIGADTFLLTGNENIFVAKYTCNAAAAVTYTSSNEQINIWPNPADEILNLEFETRMENKPIEITLTNILGEEIKELKMKRQENKNQINISNLQNGIYFVSIKTPEGNNIKKTVIQH